MNDGLGLVPADQRALIAIDLGAESCRVSLLRWSADQPSIEVVFRFPNAARISAGGLRWDLAAIQLGLWEGLHRCAAIATEGVRSIAVDGWAVDYVRVDADGVALEDPFCYRDERTLEAERALHRRCSPDRLRELTGIEVTRINTLYQLFADRMAGLPDGERWINLPEYILTQLGGDPVAEITNASHTQLIDIDTQSWSEEIFVAADLNPHRRPKIAYSGTIVGRLGGALAQLSPFANTLLIAPACHDTASAIAGIPAEGEDWAYISAGTWSLVGTLLPTPCNSVGARQENFTNLSAVGGQVCFHKSVNGMWLLRQCMSEWASDGREWTVPALIEACAAVPHPDAVLDLTDPDLLLMGEMPRRINRQRRENGLQPLPEDSGSAPVFANLIFHSLAARYGTVLDSVSLHSGKQLRRIFIVGGASQNLYLNELTATATGLEVVRGSEESSTIGNFAVQLASLEGTWHFTTGVRKEDTLRWAARLQINRA